MRIAARSFAVVLLVVFVTASRCRERECSTALADQFSRAAFVPETWLIDFGLASSPAWTSIRYPTHRDQMISGWSGDEQWGGEETSFVWAVGGSSVVHVDRFGSRDLQLRLRCRPHELAGKGVQTVTTVFNGSAVGTTTLQPGFATYDIRIPASIVRGGRNVVEFRYRYSGRPAGGVNDARALAVAWDWIEITEHRIRPHKRLPRKETAAVAVPYRSAIRYNLNVEPKSALLIDGIDVEGEADPEDRGSVRITLSSRGAALQTITTKPEGKPVRIEIPVERRTPVELEIAVLPPRERRSGTFVVLRSPRLAHRCR